jgi:hypothetical protein
MPRYRHRRHVELHDVLGRGLVAVFMVMVWFYELAIWLYAWFFIGMFLAVRDAVRAARRLA